MPHWYLIVGSTLGGVIKLTLPLVLPQVLKYFTDVLLVASNTMSVQEKTTEIYKWLIFLLFLYIVVYIPATFIRESGALVTRINSDVEQVHAFIWSVATNIWIDAIILIIYLALMLSISIPLTIVAFITLPLSVLTTKKIRARIRKSSKSAQSEISSLSGYLQERMAGYAVVKLFHMEEPEKEQFDHISESIYNFNRKRNIFVSLGIAVTGSFSEVISSVICAASQSCTICNLRMF